MIIERLWIDEVCPEHGRTSCDDINLSNAYGGWDGTYRTDNGHKNIRVPRCNRCYLLANEGFDTNDIEFKPVVEIWLQWQDIPENRK
jgi:hypothetical protein